MDFPRKTRKIGKTTAVYAFILGLLYLIVGPIEVAGGIEKYNIPGDFWTGLALLVVAANYLYAVGGLWRGDLKGASFLLTGFILSTVFGLIFILLMGANGLLYLLGEAEEFSPIADFRPEIWLFIASTPVAAFILKVKRYMHI